MEIPPIPTPIMVMLFSDHSAPIRQINIYIKNRIKMNSIQGSDFVQDSFILKSSSQTKEPFSDASTQASSRKRAPSQDNFQACELINGYTKKFMSFRKAFLRRLVAIMNNAQVRDYTYAINFYRERSQISIENAYTRSFIRSLFLYMHFILRSHKARIRRWKSPVASQIRRGK